MGVRRNARRRPQIQPSSTLARTAGCSKMGGRRWDSHAYCKRPRVQFARRGTACKADIPTQTERRSASTLSTRTRRCAVRGITANDAELSAMRPSAATPPSPQGHRGEAPSPSSSPHMHPAQLYKSKMMHDQNPWPISPEDLAKSTLHSRTARR